MNPCESSAAGSSTHSAQEMAACGAITAAGDTEDAGEALADTVVADADTVTVPSDESRSYPVSGLD